MLILYPEEDQVRRGYCAKTGGFGGAQWAGILREGKEFVEGKGGGFFPFKFNCSFTPSVVILYRGGSNKKGDRAPKQGGLAEHFGQFSLPS